MARAAVATLGHTYIINGSSHHTLPNTQTFVLINGSLIPLRLHEPFKDSQLNELLYVIIVIVFYATALMTLIITQIKRQRREGTEVDYYDEYLQRNSEVKRTCQAATTVVSTKPPSNTQSQRVTAALASAAVAAASAGSIMGSQPEDQAEIIPAPSKTEQKEPADCVVDMRGCVGVATGIAAPGLGGVIVLGDKTEKSQCTAASVAVCTTNVSSTNSLTPLLGTPANVGKLSSSFGNTRLAFARERSPTRVLESIPDEGGEE